MTAADRAALVATGAKPTSGAWGTMAWASTTEPVGATGKAATGPTSAFRGEALVLLWASVWPRNKLAASTICWQRASLPGWVVASLKRLQHRRRAWAREAKADGT